MKVTLSRDYACAPEGHTVIRFKEGSVIDGMAAELALKDGAGVLVMSDAEDRETKIDTPPETKRRGRPPKKDT